MGSSHILARFGGFLLGYSHGVSPFSGDTRSRATVLFSGYFKILQCTKREMYRFFAA